MPLLLIFFCLIFSASLPAQDTLWQLDGVVDFQLDPLGQLFIIDRSGRLMRQDAAADSTYVFDNGLLGPISRLDATNPFGPLLYFADFNKVLLLDRTLNEVGRMDLRSSTVISVSNAIARNFDNRIWVFDEGDFRLKLLSNDGSVTKQSDDLRRRLDISESPERLLMTGRELYVYFPIKGLAVFSNFGQFLRWEKEFKGVENIFFGPRAVSYHDDKELVRLAYDGRRQRSLLPPELARRAHAAIQPFRGGWLVYENKTLFYLK
jgi:hypothetical protein